MIYVSIPKKMRVENLAQLASCNDLIKLFSRHGFGIAYFGSEGVSFYDKSNRVVEDGIESVPITAFFKVSKKDFLIFAELVKRLDASQRRVNELIKFTTRVI
jgi:hypothetical protein